MANWGAVLRKAADVVMTLLDDSRKNERGRQGPRPGGTPAPAGHSGVRTAPSGDRAREITYAPDMDGAADPGEIIWTWVPFEEDASQGKDRPLLVVGRAGSGLLGLMLSSQGHRSDDANWVGIGSGAWDREGRPSYIRLDRVLEVEENGIRREGAILERDKFDRVAGELRGRYGWR
ncbi:type II toxin-antitoxin system PemK/MazF family toxin [Pseudonocardia sp. KRD291]|uniref:type II toxin-antitoxin system PemK/MazF family toxin n=1 Tax=Pseudonocardia sp. KRD291 TaxID=2792007 RepID=UPI001C4A645C|nr:type II toxin-antitoxin system PemK/MazF family toxin [Pseudonocardia sp. KRD291]MBW0102973.1 type II toxin-antitoxin system PemK/MazF family toxin [Pseudonocardia sp. KRD291]